jgi:hypothetical protein
MSKKKVELGSFDDLDRLAKDASDIRPLSPALRREWEAARRTGAKAAPAVRRGRPRKDPGSKSRIVPISIDPALLAAADRFAKATGVSRSHLVAEGLRLRLKA